MVENFKVGGLDKFGLDAESLRAANPRLIYASITGFGQDGPYAERAGYDFIIQGMGGMMSITGLPDGEPGGGPMRVGVAVVDLFTGLYTCVAILAALYRREKAARARISTWRCSTRSWRCSPTRRRMRSISGKDPPRQGNTHPNIVPYQPFDAADQPIIIAVGNDRQFARLAEMCGHPEWAEDQRFATNGARVANRAEMVALVARSIRRRPAAEWLEKLEAAGIPAGPINTITRPCMTSRRSIAEMVRTIAGMPVVGLARPARWRTRRTADCRRPRLVEHTDEVLASLSLEPARTEVAQVRGRDRLAYCTCSRSAPAGRADAGSHCRSVLAQRPRDRRRIWNRTNVTLLFSPVSGHSI